MISGSAGSNILGTFGPIALQLEQLLRNERECSKNLKVNRSFHEEEAGHWSISRWFFEENLKSSYMVEWCWMDCRLLEEWLASVDSEYWNKLELRLSYRINVNMTENIKRRNQKGVHNSSFYEKISEKCGRVAEKRQSEGEGASLSLHWVEQRDYVGKSHWKLTKNAGRKEGLHGPDCHFTAGGLRELRKRAEERIRSQVSNMPG